MREGDVLPSIQCLQEERGMPLHTASLDVISARRTASMSCPRFSVRGNIPWGRVHLIDRNTNSIYEEKVECGFHLVTQG